MGCVLSCPRINGVRIKSLRVYLELNSVKSLQPQEGKVLPSKVVKVKVVN